MKTAGKLTVVLCQQDGGESAKLQQQHTEA